MSKVTNELNQATHERELRRSEQWDEVRRWEASLAGRQAQSAQAAQQTVPAVAAPASKIEATPETWQQAYDRCQKQVMELERQASATQLRVDAVQGQIASKTQAAAQLQRELEAARQEVAAAAAERAAVAQRLQASSRRLEALRECQHLAQALRLSEEQLHGTRQMSARLEEAHTKLTDELTASRRRSEELQTLVDQSRSRLGQALVRAETAPKELS